MGKEFRIRNKPYRKSQAALEFLSTYAWAFIVISITIGALYYFGVFDFSKYLPQKCIFTSQFKCIDFSLAPTQVRLKLLNNIGEDVRVVSFQVTNDAVTPISCVNPAPFTWTRGTEQDVTFNACSGGGYITDSRIELKFTMTYYAINTPSQPTHIVYGKVNGRVTSS
jgi:hypothetical protein